MDQQVSIGTPGKLFAEPRSTGLQDFTNLVAGKGPDPLYAGQIFRDFVGDPEAARLVQKQIENKLPEVVIDKLNFLPSIFLRLGYRRTLAVCRIMVGRGVEYRGDNQPGGWKEPDSSSVRSCFLPITTFSTRSSWRASRPASSTMSSDQTERWKHTQSFASSPTNCSSPALTTTGSTTRLSPSSRPRPPNSARSNSKGRPT